MCARSARSAGTNLSDPIGSSALLGIRKLASSDAMRDVLFVISLDDKSLGNR